MIRQYSQEDLPQIADLVECFANESGCFEIVGGFSRPHFLDTLFSCEVFLRIWVRDCDDMIVSALAMVENINPYSRHLQKLAKYFYHLTSTKYSNQT